LKSLYNNLIPTNLHKITKNESHIHINARNTITFQINRFKHHDSQATSKSNNKLSFLTSKQIYKNNNPDSYYSTKHTEQIHFPIDNLITNEFLCFSNKQNIEKQNVNHNGIYKNLFNKIEKKNKNEPNQDKRTEK
jgi:hypothetical protein